MLQIEYPIAIAGLLIMSLILAIFVYWKDTRFSSTNPYTIFSLIFLRFISISLLCLLLLNPKWISEFKIIEKPIIVVLQDVSSSILNYNDSSYYKNDFLLVLEENIQQLSQNFEIYNYHFSENVYEGLSDKFEGIYTDISQGFKAVEDRFYNRNIAAVILASDGNYNLGINPIYNTEVIDIPIFTLGIGDTSTTKDILIEYVRHNEITYFENEFPVQFDILSNFNSEKPHLLSVRNNGDTVYEEWIDLKNQNPISKQIYLKALEKGVQYFDIQISSFDGEKNIQNNKHKIAIDVLNNIQNILILGSTPHPDIAALKETIEKSKNYKVRSELFNNFNEEIEPYNLIILHQLPDFSNKNINLFDKIMESKISLFYIGGNATDWPKFNNYQGIVDVKYKNSMQEVFALINSEFSPFELSESCQKFIENAPPLLAPFGEINPKNINQCLLKQQIENIKTNQNLLLFSESKQRQTAILLAEGLWKWKFYDFQNNKNHKNFTELTQNILQYLTLNRDKRKLRIQYQKILIEGEKFKIQAQLYNDNYQMLENGELNLVIINEKGTEYKYSLIPKNKKYEKIINKLEKGKYRFILSAKYKDIVIKEEGEFAVLNSHFEQQKLTSNWRNLMQISDKSNGLFIEKDDFVRIAQIINQNITSSPKVYYNKYLSDLIKNKSLFLLLLLSLTLEWLWRKTLGTH